MAQGRIADRVAIITGGGSGIGKATAELFAQEGAKVVIGDLPTSEGGQVAKAIGGLFVPTDVREAKSVEQLVRAACDKFGGKVMVEQKRGAIVNTASVAGIRGAIGLSAYNAAKHGVVGLTRNAALEFAPAGVRVNCICPGIIDTPLVARAFGATEEIRETMHRFHPLGRMGKPREIANCVLFLASDDASFVTGHALVVDGGVCAGTGSTEGITTN